MSLIIDNNTFYGYQRSLHCLRMLKRLFDAGCDVKSITKHFEIHASSTYGWSYEGEPIVLFNIAVDYIFHCVKVYEAYDEEQEKIKIFSNMEIPEELEGVLNEHSLESFMVIHISNEDFSGVDFNFRKSSSVEDNHFFSTQEDEVPIYHFRNKELTELVICIDLDFYVCDADSILEFTLWIKKQLEEIK